MTRWLETRSQSPVDRLCWRALVGDFLVVRPAELVDGQGCFAEDDERVIRLRFILSKLRSKRSKLTDRSLPHYGVLSCPRVNGFTM